MADAVLDSAIEFSHPLSPNWTEPKAVLLTGATGFLGTYLLSELLYQTTADVYCLVRADDSDAATARIKLQLQFYALWVESFIGRIIPVVGDLSKPRLGLSEEMFGKLSDQLDIIYHNGAQVNAMYSYARLKASNVLGTQEILRLAGLRKTKPVHFVSTLAVFFSDAYVGQVVLEHDRITIDSGLKGGYKQSKWVAEELIRQAQKRGLPAVIYRAGRIWGHSQTGIMTRFSDLLCNVLQACIHLRKIPVVDTNINMVPVDYVSQSIVQLSLQKRSFDQVFHLCNSNSIAWQKLREIICFCGYPLEEISYQQWVYEINRQPKNKLYTILRHLLRSPIYLFSDKPQFDNAQTQIALLQTSVSCPTVNAKLLVIYLSYFHQKGYIPAPINIDMKV